MRLFENSVQCVLTGADPAGSLLVLSDAGITIWEIRWQNDLTVLFRCPAARKAKLRQLCEKRGDCVSFSAERGWGNWLSGTLKRPVLTGGILFFLLLTLYLPTRVFFFTVEGNERIPARLILETAKDCGIGFGVSRKQVRSEKMKNALLAAMPDLKWAGINTAGCTGVISIRERMPEPKLEVSAGVSSIAACRDGYITSCTVTKGNALCVPGQVVHRGQLLISGYTDCGICLRADRAEGEIFAQTSREVTALFPAERRMIRGIGDRKYKISLIIRKKRINLWKDSRISDTGCGRMYEEYYVSLPGGYRLPIALAVEQYLEYDISGAQPSEEEVLSRLQRFSDSYLLRQTVAGKILQKQQDLRQEEGCWRLDSRYICTEMIGKEQEEQIGDIHE